MQCFTVILQSALRGDAWFQMAVMSMCGGMPKPKRPHPSICGSLRCIVLLLAAITPNSEILLTD